MTRRTSPLARWRHGLAGGGWLAVSVLAGYLAMQYDFAPGRLGPASRWPEASALRRGPAITVVAFLHPRCACTRATVTHLIATLKASPDTRLVADMFVPPEAPGASAWRDTAYVRAIRAELPRAEVVFDPGSAEAVRFGAMTSGTVLVYDARGTELFRGGITDRRGGDRPNPGLAQFAKVVAPDYRGLEARPFPVFGCPLAVEPKKEAQ